MLIVGNWKAYVVSSDKAKKLLVNAKRLSVQKDIEIVLAVPAPYLGLLSVGNQSKVSIAAQDLSVSTGGATTGEAPADLIRNLGVKYAILGHSERRAKGETDAIVLEKVQHALANKIIPIVCIGEHERDIDAEYLAFIRSQITAIYQPLTPKERTHVIFAYEPLWAIGKSAAQSITVEDLTEMVLYIRKILSNYLAGTNAAKIRLIYGGAVEAGNIKSLAQGTGIDGFLPGHASADEVSFAGLVKALK